MIGRSGPSSDHSRALWPVGRRGEERGESLDFPGKYMEMQAPQWWSLVGMHVRIDDWFNAMAFHLFFLPMNPQILKASKSRQDVQTNEEVFGNKCLVLGLFRCALCADLIPSVAFPLVFTFYFFPCLFSPCLNCRLVSIILWPFFFFRTFTPFLEVLSNM